MNSVYVPKNQSHQTVTTNVSFDKIIDTLLKCQPLITSVFVQLLCVTEINTHP